MGQAFLLGMAAAYAIAIPVGPVAGLILRTGMGRGLRAAAAAGAGAATADLLFATIAMLFGAAASVVLAPILPVARIVAAAALAAIAFRGLLARPRSIERESSGLGTGTPFSFFVGFPFWTPPTAFTSLSLPSPLP